MARKRFKRHEDIIVYLHNLHRHFSKGKVTLIYDEKYGAYNYIFCNGSVCYRTKDGSYLPDEVEEHPMFSSFYTLISPDKMLREWCFQDIPVLKKRRVMEDIYKFYCRTTDFESFELYFANYLSILIQRLSVDWYVYLSPCFFHYIGHIEDVKQARSLILSQSPHEIDKTTDVFSDKIIIMPIKY